MGCIRFCVCGWVPVRGFLYLLWREIHTKGLRTKFPTRPEEDEERQGPRAGNRSRRKATVRERRLLNEELGPVDPEAGSASARGWVRVLGSCVGIFEYTLATDRSIECWESDQTFPFLHLDLTQVRACLFFSSTLSVVYVVSCMFVKQCEMPMAGDERNHKTIGWPKAGLGDWDSGGRPASI